MCVYLRLPETKPPREIAALVACPRNEIEKSKLRLRAEVTQGQNQVIFWVVGLMLAQAVLCLTLQKLIDPPLSRLPLPYLPFQAVDSPSSRRRTQNTIPSL